MKELSKDFSLSQIKPEESFDGVYYVTSSTPVNGKLHVTADKVYFFFEDKAKKAPRCIDIKNIKTMKKGLMKRLSDRSDARNFQELMGGNCIKLSSNRQESYRNQTSFCRN